MKTNHCHLQSAKLYNLSTVDAPQENAITGYSELHLVLLLNPGSHVHSPGDWYEGGPKDVGGVNSSLGNLVQDVGLVDAVRANDESYCMYISNSI